MLKDDALDTETTEDIRTAVSTIQRRSEGLLHFVEAYRDHHPRTKRRSL